MHSNQQDPRALTSIMMDRGRRFAVSSSIALAQAVMRAICHTTAASIASEQPLTHAYAWHGTSPASPLLKAHQVIYTSACIAQGMAVRLHMLLRLAGASGCCWYDEGALLPQHYVHGIL